METFSPNWPFVRGIRNFPTQRQVTRTFDVFFDLRLNKRLSKKPWGWFETPSWSLWRQCNGQMGPRFIYIYRAVFLSFALPMRDVVTSNAVSHWLGACLELYVYIYIYISNSVDGAVSLAGFFAWTGMENCDYNKLLFVSACGRRHRDSAAGTNPWFHNSVRLFPYKRVKYAHDKRVKLTSNMLSEVLMHQCQEFTKYAQHIWNCIDKCCGQENFIKPNSPLILLQVYLDLYLSQDMKYCFDMHKIYTVEFFNDK